MTPVRRVRQLTLRAPRREHVARALTLLEDAFHTFTVPHLAPGCVLVVRKLDLGSISIARPSQHIARRLTERLRHLARTAVPHDHPSAARADAVFWPDRSTARAALVLRCVAGPAPREWFWRGVNGEVRADQPLHRVVSAWLLPAPLPGPREPPPLVVAAHTLRVLLQHNAAPRALALLPPAAVTAQLERVAPAALLPLTAASAERAGSSREVDRLPVLWRALLDWSVRQLPHGDPRRAWIACCALVCERPELAGTPQLGALVRRVSTQLDAPPGLPRRMTVQPARANLGGMMLEPSSPPAKPARPVAFEASAAPSVGAGAPARAPQPSAARGAGRPAVEPKSDAGCDPLDPHRDPLRVPPLQAPARTEFAGLLFLLPVLAKLELERVLRAEPALLDQLFGVRVLFAALDRLGAEPLSPMRRALAPARDPIPLTAQPFVAPPSWWSASDELVCHPVPGAGFLVRGEESDLWLAHTVEDPSHVLDDRLSSRALRPGADVSRELLPRARLEGWLAAAVRLLRRTARLDLDALIRRRGIVASGPTHIDVALPWSELDLRVRSRALDADPGWVAYLGRVITFHYLEHGDFENAWSGLAGSST